MKLGKLERDRGRPELCVLDLTFRQFRQYFNALQVWMTLSIKVTLTVSIFCFPLHSDNWALKVKNVLLSFRNVHTIYPFRKIYQMMGNTHFNRLYSLQLPNIALHRRYENFNMCQARPLFLSTKPQGSCMRSSADGSRRIWRLVLGHFSQENAHLGISAATIYNHLEMYDM